MYIKIITDTKDKENKPLPAVTVAKAAAMANIPHESKINIAIKDDKLDYGYAMDELRKKPKIGTRPKETTDKYGIKLVILNEKWENFLESLKK